MIAFMNKMGFISEGGISSDKEEQPITRMDFAMFTARILGVSEDGESDNNYFYDIKVVCGTAVTRFVENQLKSEGTTIPPITTNTALLSAINDIKNEEAKAIAMSCYTENIPLIQPYQTKYVLVDHGQILVDTNLRGGSN